MPFWWSAIKIKTDQEDSANIQETLCPKKMIIKPFNYQ